MEPQKILKLEKAVINRIAAGEVIQRPVNALKELIENSLDAHATNVQITVKNGGLKYMQIQDNGIGIRKEDFEIVCERFTTSKLSDFEDLASIATYGFRGEALGSISHAAHLTIQSKTANEQCAYKASYQDGKLKGAPKPVAGNQGTQITMEDLFYNMDIRKRAIKSAVEEYQKIADLVGKFAIHNAKVGFALRKQGDSNDLRTPVGSTHVENIRTIYGMVIARELMEFEFNCDVLKFKSKGCMTNVNYSSKKMVFVLFINHRLVDCKSLKKCLVQVYSTYLPKNAFPFIYLSVELDPKTLDVNVHPTKHEVNFLNEEQIVEKITTAVEKTLLESNNSRVFYTKARLPVMTLEPAKESVKVVQDKNLIRTDSNNQKLDKFFGAPKKSDQSLTEEDYQVLNKEFLQNNEEFEDRLVKDSPKGKKKIKSETISSALVSKVTRVECQLLSVLQLRKEVEEACHLSLRTLFAQHVFVGCVDPDQALVQYSTKLFLCHTKQIMQELFYQLILYNFQNFGTITFNDPLSIEELALLSLDLPENGWSPDDGDKNELSKRVAEILTEKGEMLKQYFMIDIDEFGQLNGLPILLENHIPIINALPTYLLRLATEVSWDTEKDCFADVSKETANFYSKIDDSCENWKWTVEHVFFSAIKDYFLPPKEFVENAVVLEIADLPKLYKVFERC